MFDWFGLVCFANKNKNYQLSHNWFQTSQTGGQWYGDTSPFSIPCWNSLWLCSHLPYMEILAPRHSAKMTLRLLTLHAECCYTEFNYAECHYAVCHPNDAATFSTTALSITIFSIMDFIVTLSIIIFGTKYQYVIDYC